MILKIILWIILFLLLFILLYPLRIGFMVYFTEYKPRFKLVFYPVFTLERFSRVIVDTAEPKAEKAVGKDKKKNKSPKSGDKAKAEKTADSDRSSPQRQLVVSELIIDIVAILGKLKSGLKKLYLTINLGYGLEDPALTGEITGLAYSTLPPLLGDGRRRHCHCRLRLYPAWCPPAPCIDVRGELICNLLQLLVAFVPLLPEVLGIIKKLKKKK